MESIRVAAVQMNARLGEVEENLEAIEDWSRKAAQQGAELVVFPELVITGHWCSTKVWEVAEAVPGGESVRRLER